MQAVLPTTNYSEGIEFSQKYPDTYLKNHFDMPFWHLGMYKMIGACKKGLEEHKPVVVSSGHAQSKDYLFGRMPLWFLEAYGPSIILMTAPTERQVQHIMWAELTSAYNSRKDPEKHWGNLLRTKLEVNENHYILPFTTKDATNAIGKFQGFHGKNMMVVFSEAQAITDEVYDQVEGCLTGGNWLWVILGNPLRASGRFAQMINHPEHNIVIHLNCLDSPNYKEKRDVIPGMASCQWIEDKRKRWGTEDPRWFGRVLGQVPPTGIQTVISPKLYKTSQERKTNFPRQRIVVACDVATAGDDDCVIYGGKDGEVIEQFTISGATDLRIVAHEMHRVGQKIHANTYVYDGNGVGDGLGVILRDIIPEKSVKIAGIKGSEKATQDGTYQNARAERFFKLRDKMTRGFISAPNDDSGGRHDQLRDEITQIDYFVNQRGRIQLEDKDDIKEKLGHSPNKADAFVLLSEGFDIAEGKAREEERIEKRRKLHLVRELTDGVRDDNAYGDWGM